MISPFSDLLNVPTKHIPKHTVPLAVWLIPLYPLVFMLGLLVGSSFESKPKPPPGQYEIIVTRPDGVEHSRRIVDVAGEVCKAVHDGTVSVIESGWSVPHGSRLVEVVPVGWMVDVKRIESPVKQ